MRCKKYREKIILYLYDELIDIEKTEVEKHIEGCSDCADDLEFTKKVFKLVDVTKDEKVPEGNWETCWQRIDARTVPAPKKLKGFAFPYRTVFAAAAILIVFVIGIVIGKFWLPSRQKSQLPLEASAATIEPSLKNHFENLKPVLTEYANYTPSEREETTIIVDREVLESLLIQNYLLKKALENLDNPSMEQFLEDVELILREISNLEKEDRSTLSMIKETINQRDILFKMNVFQKI